MKKYMMIVALAALFVGCGDYLTSDKDLPKEVLESKFLQECKDKLLKDRDEAKNALQKAKSDGSPPQAIAFIELTINNFENLNKEQKIKFYKDCVSNRAFREEIRQSVEARQKGR